MNITTENFQKIQKAENDLVNLNKTSYDSAVGAENKEYWAAVEKFKKQLKEFIANRDNDIADLSKADLLHLCAIVSSHRPVALHSFLVELSNAHSRLAGTVE